MAACSTKIVCTRIREQRDDKGHPQFSLINPEIPAMWIKFTRINRYESIWLLLDCWPVPVAHLNKNGGRQMDHSKYRVAVGRWKLVNTCSTFVYDIIVTHMVTMKQARLRLNNLQKRVFRCFYTPYRPCGGFTCTYPCLTIFAKRRQMYLNSMGVWQAIRLSWWLEIMDFHIVGSGNLLYVHWILLSIKHWEYQ